VTAPLTIAIPKGRVMKVLAMLSTVMLPIGLVTGFYGMNFDFLPAAHERWGAGLALGLTALLVGALLAFYRWAGWLGK